MTPNQWTKAWALWLLGSVAGFSAIELRAMREPGAATLTAHLYHLCGFGEPGRIAAIKRAAFYSAWGWVPLHIAHHSARCVSCISSPMPLP